MEIIREILDLIFCFDSESFSKNNIVNKIYCCIMSILFLGVLIVSILCCAAFFDFLKHGSFDSAMKMLIVILILLISIIILFAKPLWKAWKSRKK